MLHNSCAPLSVLCKLAQCCDMLHLLLAMHGTLMTAMWLRYGVCGAGGQWVRNSGVNSPLGVLVAEKGVYIGIEDSVLLAMVAVCCSSRCG
jgi:hypothetical protein